MSIGVVANHHSHGFLIISFVDVGATRQALTKAMILDWEVPIPPPKEQNRIIAEIEKQFTRLDKGEAALLRVRSNLKRYRTSILNAACEGRLVQTNSRTWPRLTLEELCSKITDGEHQTPKRQKTGRMLLSAKNVRDGFIDYNDHDLISEHDFLKARARCNPQPNDILVVCVGATIGRSAIISNDLEFALTRSAALLRPTKIDPKFLLFAMQSDVVQKQIANLKRGSAQPHLFLNSMRTIRVPLPLPTEQKEIVAEVEWRLSIAEQIKEIENKNLLRVARLRQSILERAFRGKLVPQHPTDEPANLTLTHLRTLQATEAMLQQTKRTNTKPSKETGEASMTLPQHKQDSIDSILERTSGKPDALRLFQAADLSREDVYSFYDSIADSAEAVKRFTNKSSDKKKSKPSRKVKADTNSTHCFRLHSLWIKRFKNLDNYLVTFDNRRALDVLLGWNGTGKSNFFEVLIVIFRDLHKWQPKSKWITQEGLEGFRIRYEIEGHLFEVNWDNESRRPEIATHQNYDPATKTIKLEPCSKETLLLPHFVFGYYSGPSNRFAELFAEPKQDHYERLLKTQADDEKTLARLLEDRRFFCAETHHAKYALLAFFYQDEPSILDFLKKHLRIVDLESVLFILKRPRWHRNNNPEDFWGAEGLLRPVLERLRRHSIAPMVLPQRVDDGYQESTRDHYFLLLPNKAHLQALASEYGDPTSFFVALESTDFSSIIHEVRIRVRINATSTMQTVITFKEMSEGEQQLLMVLGLLRFTKMNQSLVLLDEPDTHLNPHWQLGYLRLLLNALVTDKASQSTTERTPIEDLEKHLSSQVLLSTHDPLAIAGLLKENIHLLRRQDQSEQCVSTQATENPRGMGFTGILISIEIIWPLGQRFAVPQYSRF